MSTTLANGIIIPDNGSRNWGGDLANNWNIIDVNVGYMTDVKNKVTTLENSVAENTANIQTNASNISALQTSKQDVIDDLETIRTGASAGATAVQPNALNNYYTKADVDTALTSKANDADVVHKSGDETINGVKNFTDIQTEIINDTKPASLSFPSTTYVSINTTDWSLDGSTVNQISTPTYNSYLSLMTDCDDDGFIEISLGNYPNGHAYINSKSVHGHCGVFIPLANTGSYLKFFIKANSIRFARFYSLHGNV